MKKILLSLMLLTVSFIIGCETNSARYDYVIKNGKIIDGTGNPWYQTDIGIIGDKIAEIGIIPEESCKRIIDASGKVVTPGFIDIHSHADDRILEDRTAHNLIIQGATTVLGGNCGGSHLNLHEFFKKLESNGIALNLATLIGHNTIRREVMGNMDREPTQDELSKMKRIVEIEMKAGALGLSTGLKYLPGAFSSTEEVIELAKVVSDYWGFYASHLRDEGLKLFESIEEAVEIGEKANIPVQISHHKAVGADMWGESRNSLKMMENVRKKGIDVTTDQHPYPATFTGITIIFPEWAIEGDEAKIKTRLNNPDTRRKVIDGIVYNIKHDRGGNDIRNITIAMYTKDTLLEGKNLHEILIMKGRETTMENAAELLIELYENENAQVLYHCLSMEDVVRIMAHPLTMHASDAGISEFNKGKIHPRHYGHFPRILALHVRERGDLSIEEAIRKMTSFPASRIGLRDRGVLLEGKCADIVIFDPDTIQDKATWDNPHQYPEGIDYVMCNGEITVDHGNITGNLPGKVIYGPGKK
ncbi:amidohydrolase family protein [Candidatus Latescibacterota bacterium]